MVDKIPYCSDMISHFFRKREGFSYRAGNSLPHVAVETLDMICFSASLSYRPMTHGRKHLLIRRPEFCIRNSTLPVNSRQGIPKFPRTFPVTVSYMYTGNFFRFNIFCQPYPYLILFFPYKGPHFTAFNCKTSFLLPGNSSFFWNIFIFAIRSCFKNIFMRFFSIICLGMKIQ